MNKQQHYQKTQQQRFCCDQQKQNQQRYKSIDILRAIAIFIMVPVHFIIYLNGDKKLGDISFSPAFFAFANGFSYKLWLDSYTDKQIKKWIDDVNIQKQQKQQSRYIDKKIMVSSIKQGLFLIAMAVVCQGLKRLEFDYYSLLDLDILVFHGSTRIILGTITRKLSPLINMYVATLVLFVTPLIQYILDWDTSYYKEETSLYDALQSLIGVGYFPIFPWIIYPIIGYATACTMMTTTSAAVVRDDDEDKIDKYYYHQRQYSHKLITCGLILIGLSMTTLKVNNILITSKTKIIKEVSSYALGGWYKWPASSTFVFGSLGITLMVFGLLRKYIDLNPNNNVDTNNKNNKIEKLVVNVCSIFSRNALSIYIIHHIAIMWPTFLIGYVKTNSRWAYIREPPLSKKMAMVVSLLYLISTYIFYKHVIGITKRQRRIGFEALMDWFVKG